MNASKWPRLALAGALYAVGFLVAGAVGGLGYFHFGNPQETCAACHEMTGVHSDWSVSPHRTVHCRTCHGGSLTLDVHALQSHLNRIVRHFSPQSGPEIRLKERHIADLSEACRDCHPQAFADWRSSRHATTYARIFLDPAHNRTAPPTDDCLRCHGMFFEGDITDLVRRTSAGSFALRDDARGAQPAIPCLACHQVHAPAGASLVAGIYDRRERSHYAANLLPVAQTMRHGQPLRISSDPVQRVCVRCHATSATRELGTSDDRTPAGVHEGLSCRDCHWSHTQSAQASCGACHPAQSHCGLEVQKMDTTYLSTSSKHNVHTVACTDCHPQGRPAPRTPQP